MTVFLCRTWWAKRLRQSFMEVNIVLSNPSALLWRRWAVWEWQSFIKITITPLALGFRIHKHTGRLFKLEACGHVCCHLPCPHFKKIKRPTSALSCSVFHHHQSWKIGKKSCKILSRNANRFTFNFHHYKLILNIHFVFIFSWLFNVPDVLHRLYANFCLKHLSLHNALFHIFLFLNSKPAIYHAVFHKSSIF